MSETTQHKKMVLTKTNRNAYEAWRLLKDRIARYGVIIGGISVIVAVVLIFFYLLYVVSPLFLSASAKTTGQYALPNVAAGKTVLLDMEEQNKVAARFTDSGQVVFFEVATGKVLLSQQVTIPAGVTITSFAQASPASSGVVVYGLSNGQVVMVKTQYESSYQNNTQTITPSLYYPSGEQALVLTDNSEPLEKIAAMVNDGSTTLAAKTPSQIHLTHFEKETSLFAEEASLKRSDAVLEIPAEGVEAMLLDRNGKSLYLVGSDGRLSVFDVNDKTNPLLKQHQNVVEAGQKITRIAFLNGDLSLLVGDSTGLVSQWSIVRDKLNHASLQKIRSFKVSNKAVVAIQSEQRRKGFITVDGDGMLGIYNSTAERELVKTSLGSVFPVATALSPRANSLLVQLENDQMAVWHIDNEHPEVSIGSLWQQVWYESYPKPDYIWQSSSANSDFEPKYSLTPLVFGTMKAAFYSMLVAVPLALMGAIYTAYFMSPHMRQYVKPTIELMGALPTVILGFLAGLWLAPLVEANLAGFFLLALTVPGCVMLFALAWQLSPPQLQQKLTDGWDAALLVPVILFSGWLAFRFSTPVETLLFSGSLRDWMKNTWGIGYDQRNALIVGIAMGFAVIPNMFSIAEDAIFSVPKHLTVGSLALGATTWQTMTKVVLLTASPGIFSAIMIGLGRAVGETMIVLMATGNTPVMDLSLFQGLRTLAANIAVEMPESEVNSTHYRVLFLAALVLFVFTFVFNTLAEVIRQRLREKYSSL
jgi:phosphate transport system permease protein